MHHAESFAFSFRPWASVLGVGLCFTACTSPSSPPRDPTPAPSETLRLADGRTFVKKDVFASLGQCILSQAQEFRSASQAFAEATAVLPTEGPSKEKARSAWARAMDGWQRLEVLQIGPAAAASLPGGKELRDGIYPWPLANRCLVEQTLVNQSFAGPDFTAGLVHTRGLWTAEYLLFYEGTDNACAPTASINTQGTWAGLGAIEVQKRKASYLHRVATDVAEKAQALVDAWSPEKGRFLEEFSNAGLGSRVYRSPSMAFNAVTDALFYIDQTTKDLKVGRPAGLTQCPTPTCPEAVESPFAGRSKDHIRNNLLGFRMAFAGCNPSDLGLDDYLTALGQGAVSTRILDSTQRALETLDAIEEADLREALQKDLASVKALHGALKALSDLLKGELVTLLDVEIPKRVEGDND